MKKVILLIFLLHSLFAFRSHNRFKLQNRQNPQNFASKLVAKTFGQVTNNEMALKRFHESPNGLDDKDEEDHNYMFYLKEVQRQDPEWTQMQAKFSVQTVRINNNAVFYGESEQGYRAVFGALTLKEIISPSDNVQTGHCCVNVGSIALSKGLITGINRCDYFCITLLTEYTEWKVCHQDPTYLGKFRSSIVLHVIKYYFFSIGEYRETEALSNFSFEFKMDWSFDSEKTWKGICKDGRTQSPVGLQTKESVMTDEMRIIFKFHSHSVPVVKFDGNENVVYGDFGTFVHQLEIGQRSYTTQELRFRFPSEHSLDETSYHGEMLIFGKSSNDQEAIVSMFLKSSDAFSTDHNIFVDNLLTPEWNTEGKAFRIDTRPDLSKIVKGGITAYYQKSFFWYVGSITTPPCTQGINRFVMKEAILLPSIQYESLKSATFNHEETDQSSRQKIFSTEGRMIYYHIDKSVNCHMASDKILALTEDEIARKRQVSDVERGHFYRLQTRVNAYAATTDRSKFGDREVQGFEIAKVPEGEVPPTILENLKAQQSQHLEALVKSTFEQGGVSKNNINIKSDDSKLVSSLNSQMADKQGSWAGMALEDVADQAILN